MTENPTKATARGREWDAAKEKGSDRREVEENAEVERQNTENVPHGRDIQDTVGGQGKDVKIRDELG